MINLEETTARITSSFEAIHRDAMADVPILNHALNVEVVGLHEREGRAMGIIVTPWLMSFIIVGKEDDDWASRKTGSHEKLAFPSGELDFKINHFDGIGPCATYGIQSPMSCFADQNAALASANVHLANLDVQAEVVDTSEEDEKLRRFLEGDENALSKAEAANEAGDNIETENLPDPEGVSRRGLLRGQFSTSSQSD